MSTPAQPLMQQSDTIESFAGKIRTKFPDGVDSAGRAYKEIPDEELVDRVVQKHPVYSKWLHPDEYGKLPSVQASAPGAGPELVKRMQAGNVPQGPATALAPTQFEKERPGKGITTEGALSTFWEGLKSVPGAALQLLDPTRGLSGAALTSAGINPRSGGASERLGEVPIVRAAKEFMSARKAPEAGPIEKAAAGPGALVGMSDEAARAAAARGEGGKIIGQAAVPLGMTAAAELAGPMLGAEKSAIERVSESAPVQIVKTAGKRLAEPLGIGVTGERMVKQGVSPYAKQLGFDKALNTAGEDIVRYHKETPIKTVADLHEALPEIQKEIMEKEIRPAARAHADEALAPERWQRIDKDVAESVHPFQAKIEGEEIPAAAKEVLEKIHKAGTIGDIVGVEAGDRGGALGWLNGQLEAYFKKYPSAQRGDLMRNPDTAALEGARRALRSEALQQLEEGGEEGIRGARTRWGAIEELRQATERRINQADRLKPIGLGKALGLVAAPKTAGLSYILGSIADWLNKPDTLVGRGVEKMAKTREARPITVKARELPAPAQAALPEPKAAAKAAPAKAELDPSWRNPNEVPKGIKDPVWAKGRWWDRGSGEYQAQRKASQPAKPISQAQKKTAEKLAELEEKPEAEAQQTPVKRSAAEQTIQHETPEKASEKPAKQELSGSQIDDAELGIRQELEQRGSMEKPGRYFIEDTAENSTTAAGRNAAKGERMGGHWMGVKGYLAEKDFPYTHDFTRPQVERALERGEGPHYEKIIRRAMRSQEDVDKATQFTQEGKRVYRAHDVGKTEVDLGKHAHATASKEEAKSYIQHRNPGTPQKVSSIDLGKWDPEHYEEVEGPRGNKWYRFKRQPKPEEYEPEEE